MCRNAGRGTSDVGEGADEEFTIRGAEDEQDDDEQQVVVVVAIAVILDEADLVRVSVEEKVVVDDAVNVVVAAP